jgi:hypothetical protein
MYNNKLNEEVKRAKRMWESGESFVVNKGAFVDKAQKWAIDESRRNPGKRPNWIIVSNDEASVNITTGRQASVETMRIFLGGFVDELLELEEGDGFSLVGTMPSGAKGYATGRCNYRGDDITDPVYYIYECFDF